MGKALNKVLDIGVARYMGSGAVKSPFGRKLLGVFSSGVLPDTDEGHFTNAFDWNDSVIWTSCDCFLAANKWNVRSGEHYGYFLGKNQSYSTLITRACGDGAIYGNGGDLYFSSSKNKAQLLYEKGIIAIETIQTFKGWPGKVLLLTGTNSSDFGVTVFERDSSYSDFTQRTIHIDKQLFAKEDVYRSRLKVELIEKKSLVLLYRPVHKPGIEDLQELFIIDLNTEKCIAHCEVHGIQNLSYHPNGEKIAVLGTRLSIRSTQNLNQVENEIELTVARDENISSDYGSPISYSTCGRFIALSYAVSGEIEIRDAETLEKLTVLEGYGIPMSDMSWDITGKFLACRFMSRESGSFQVLAWHVDSEREVLRVPASRMEYNQPGFRWSTSNTSLAVLVERKRIQVFRLSE